MSIQHLILALAVTTAATLGGGCTKKSDGPTLWIYTSLYNHVVQDLNTRLAAKFPGVTFKWYQSGSENVAAKVNTELLSGKTQADLILTSDLFWYEDLKSKRLLLAYDSPAATLVAAPFKDPEHFWCVARAPVMVIAYHSDSFRENEAPRSFADLLLPRFRDKVAMGSPLESGTAFTTVALLARIHGWDYFARLRANGALAAGGNSSVIARIETKERPVGIVLLENVLAARRKNPGNPKITAVYPADGAVTIPSPIAIVAGTTQPELARRVYDFFLARDGQEAVVKGDMHSLRADVPPPAGARPWPEILAKSVPWSLDLIQEIRAERESIKRQFAKLMLD